MALNPATLVELPEQLSGYRLLERLGRGGFGEVWKVEAPGGFLKAMKFVFGDLDSMDEEGRPAEQELKALHRVKSIRHPYILSLERFDIIRGQLIIVMELADRNLWDRFRECRMLGMPGIPREELIRYMLESAEALDLMNKHYNIQHLDIKPQNIFLVFDHVKVADFGLAKAFEGIKATVTGGVTPVYAAPETFEGYVSRYCDQYSLAIVYQELLTGVRPFNGGNTKQLLLQHLRDAPDLNSLPFHDRDIIGRALSKKPEDRWPTCMELIQQLRKAPERGVLEIDSTALPLPDLSKLPTLSSQTPQPPMPAGHTVMATQSPEDYDPRTLTAGAARAQGIPMGPASVLNDKLVRTPGAPSLPLKALPSLVTPKQAGPRGGAAGILTVQRQQIVETGRMGQLGIAPLEKTGDGVLFPALLIGLGKTGADVLRYLSDMLKNRFQHIPAHLKFLYLDTDPEAVQAAISPDTGFLEMQDVVTTRLNRPGHYLNRESLPQIDLWMPQGLLYQLPKNPGPAGGVRAYGRLALLDNYRSVVARIRQALEPLMSEDLLNSSAKKLQLTVRSNQLRVYLIANLAGGTGSGMILDLAYLCRHELLQVGFKKPDTVGMVFLPNPDSKSTTRQAQANVFASLAELNHYSCGNHYSTQFDTSEPPVIDTDAPLGRISVVELLKRSSPAEQESRIRMASRELLQELVTPIGKKTDFVRSVAPRDPLSGPTVQAFGLYRLEWPRSEILNIISKRLCQQILRRWADKESTHLKEPIHAWLTNQWSKNRLAVEPLFERLQYSVTQMLRETPEAVFDAALDTLKTRTPSAGRMDAIAAVNVLDQMVRLVGKPEGSDTEQVPTLIQYVSEIAKQLANDAETHLSAVAVSFLEQPQYRIAGVEEALTQMTERLKSSIETLENLRANIAKDVAEAYSRLFPLIGGLNSSSGFGALISRKGAITSELIELLGIYPRRKYRLLIIDAALTIYRGLLSGIPDYQRDVSYCRTRLESLAQAIGPHIRSKQENEPAEYILPVGCDNLEAAADQFIALLPPEDLLRFDGEFQEVIKKKFKGLTTLCLEPEKAVGFTELFLEHGRAFIDSRLEHADPAEALSNYRGDGQDCLDLLTQAFEKAAPLISLVEPRQHLEGSILAVPPGTSGEHLRDLVNVANPGIEFIPAESPDELVFYRELPLVPISELKVMGTAGSEAYLAQHNSNAPPHARVDIKWIAPMKPATPR